MSWVSRPINFALGVFAVVTNIDNTRRDALAAGDEWLAKNIDAATNVVERASDHVVVVKRIFTFSGLAGAAMTAAYLIRDRAATRRRQSLS